MRWHLLKGFGLHFSIVNIFESIYSPSVDVSSRQARILIPKSLFLMTAPCTQLTRCSKDTPRSFERFQWMMVQATWGLWGCLSKVAGILGYERRFEASLNLSRITLMMNLTSLFLSGIKCGALWSSMSLVGVLLGWCWTWLLFGWKWSRWWYWWTFWSTSAMSKKEKMLNVVIFHQTQFVASILPWFRWRNWWNWSRTLWPLITISFRRRRSSRFVWFSFARVIVTSRGWWSVAIRLRIGIVSLDSLH